MVNWTQYCLLFIFFHIFSRHHGMAYVFDTISSAIKYQPITITPNGLARKSFGSSVALINDQKTNWLAIGAPFDGTGSNSSSYPGGLIYLCPIDLLPSNCIPMKPTLADQVTNGFSIFGHHLRFAVNSSRLQVLRPRKVGFYSVTDFQALASNPKAYSPQWFSVLDEDLPNDRADYLGREGEIGTWAYDALHLYGEQWLYVTPFAYLGTGAITLSAQPPPMAFKFNDTRNEYIKKHSYAGTSLARGRVFGGLSESTVTIAVGAPGVTTENDPDLDNLGAGVVAIMNVDLNAQPLRGNLVDVLVGPRFGSSFGRTVLFLDVNGDGWDDLLVGVPFYLPKEENLKQIDGAVFVYLHQGSASLSSGVRRKLPFQEKPLILRPLRTTRSDSSNSTVFYRFRYSRFGINIVALGDLNMDGCQDFAVSAPYEGNGSVYIFLGSRDGLIQNASQKLTGDDWSPPLQGFGVSLDASLDVDNNGYKDLFIGAVDSEKAVLVRARPSIRFYTLSMLPKALIGVEYLDQQALEQCPNRPSGERRCLTLSVAVYYEFLHKRPCGANSPSYKGNFTLLPDFNVTNSPRVRILNHDETGTFTTTCRQRQPGDDNTPAPADSRKVVVEFPVDIFTDYVKAIVFRLRLAVDMPNPTPPPKGQVQLTDLSQWPLYDPIHAYVDSKIFITKYCRVTQPCTANLEGSFGHTFPTGDDGQLELRIGTDDLTFTLSAQVRNLAPPGTLKAEAHQTIFRVKTSNLNAMIPLPSDTSKQRTMPDTDEVLCLLGNPLMPGQSSNCSIVFTLPADIQNLNFKSLSLNLSITTNEGSPMSRTIYQNLVAFLKMEADITFEFRRQEGSSLRFGQVAKPIGASAFTDLWTISEAVDFTFRLHGTLTNSYIPSSSVVFDWPIEVSGNPREKHGKYLLYFVSLHLTRGSFLNITCDENTRYLWNNRSYKDRFSATSSSRHNYTFPPFGPVTTKYVYQAPELKVLTHKKLDYLNCTNGYVRCVPIVCKLGPLTKKTGNVEILLRSQVWLNTFMEEFHKVDKVNVAVRATWVPEGEFAFVFKNKSESGYRHATVEVANEIKIGEREQEHMIFIIAGAVLLGLLLVALIFLLMCRCGFFDRKKQLRAKLKMEGTSRYSQEGGNLLPPEPASPGRVMNPTYQNDNYRLLSPNNQATALNYEFS